MPNSLALAPIVGLLLIFNGAAALPAQRSNRVFLRSNTNKPTTASSYSTSWTSTPTNGIYATSGFGGVTKATGDGYQYCGNRGVPYGSNIIEVDESEASQYKNVVQFSGRNTDEWTVVIGNKCTDKGTPGTWFHLASTTFTLTPKAVKYFAFDDDSQGFWAAAKGTVIPTGQYGQYASTWGEFDMGSFRNEGWSGFDVSAIQAQIADREVQGMEIRDALGSSVSSISKDAAIVNNAYTKALADENGIGGNLPPGPNRWAVTIDY